MKKRYSKKTPWVKTGYAKARYMLFCGVVANWFGANDLVHVSADFPGKPISRLADFAKAMEQVSGKVIIANNQMLEFAAAAGRLRLTLTTT